MKNSTFNIQHSTFKIASLVPYKIIPPVKGGEKAIFLFLKYLTKHCTATIFSVEENKGFHAGADFLPVLGSTNNKLRYLNLLLFFRIKNICKKNNITHLVLEQPYYAWLGWLLKKFAGIKIILRSHNIEAERFKSMGKWWWPIMKCYEQFAHRMAHVNFFITEEDKDAAIQQYHLNKKLCTVITYGIERQAAPSFEEKAACKKIFVPI